MAKYLKLMGELSKVVVHREWEIEGLVYGLLTGYPTMWIGPIGIAKTYLIDLLTNAVDGTKLFRILLTKFTEPEEVVGPFDPRLLRKGKYVRIWKGRLPDADVAYLDEVFKASPSIRNFLLDMILYGRFFDGERYVKVRTKAIYMSANETPRLVEDMAFFDRSAVRIFSQHLGWEEVIDVLATPMVNSVEKVVTISEVEDNQREVLEIERSVVSDQGLITVIRDIAKEYKERAGDVEVSERRLVMVRRLVATASLIYGESPNVDLAAVASAYSLPASWESYTAVLSAINRLFPDSSIAYLDKLNTVKSELRNAKSEEDKEKIQAKLIELTKQAPRRFFLGTTNI